MTIIQITGVSGSAPNYRLELSDHGHSVVRGKVKIQWQVIPNTKVVCIEDIFWKDVSGSTDIFDPPDPEPLNPQKTVWQGKNKSGIACTYIYGIKWVHADDGKTYDFDPIISIRPALDPGRFSLMGGLLGVVGVVALGAAILLIRNRRTK